MSLPIDIYESQLAHRTALLHQKLKEMPFSAEEHATIEQVFGKWKTAFAEVEMENRFDRRREKERAAVVAIEEAMRAGSDVEQILTLGFQSGPIADINWDELNNRHGGKQP